MRLRVIRTVAAGLILCSVVGCTAPVSPTQRYVHHALDLMGKYGYFVDEGWDAEVARTVDATQGAATPADAYGALALALDLAGGQHSSLLRPTSSTSSSVAPSESPSVTAQGQVGVVSLPSINTEDQEQMAQYAERAIQGIVTSEADASCGWVVDLRGNPGGSLYPMLLAVAPLLPENTTVLGFQDRDGVQQEVRLHRSSVTVDDKVVVEVTGDVPRFSSPVVILQDQVTASAAEGVLVAFTGQRDAHSIGQPSAGYSTGNVAFDLSDGAQLVVTASVFVDREGKTYGGSLSPDERVAGPDAQMSAAQDWLTERC